jgi:ribonucleotide reductase alpha subunit
MFPSDSAASHSSNGHSGIAAAAQLGFGFAERRASVLQGIEEVALPATIVKRDGRVVPFDPMRIERAISRCFAALGRQPFTPVAELAVRVVNIMSARPSQPSVEIVQDAVELTLQAAGEFEAAKAYILYRAEHAKQRQERPIPEDVRAAFAEADQYFPTSIQKFQFFDKYSRFDYDKGRRETWIETVDRAVAFLHELVETNTGVDLGSDLYARLRRMILEMKSMPSMRLLAMAGPPARRDSTAIYNCSYQPVDGIDAFAEGLLISMAGCGVGFSVESRYVENFPRIHRQRGYAPSHHVVEDSAQGWAAAVREGMHAWFEGGDVEFNYDQVRAAGVPLRTKGGRASGPGPLRTMLEFARARILARQGMHLRPIDAHDIMCMVGNAAVSGGVRRTAMISLFDYDDLEMRLCKSGDFERDNSQRWNANNSAVWPERGLDQIQVMEQVLDMVKSQRGEPGIFSRQAAIELMPERRKRLGGQDLGTNPCVTGDTWVHTTNGPRQVRDLVGRSHQTFVNGEAYATTEQGFWHSSTRPVVRVRTREGYTLRLTTNHQVLAISHQSRKVQRAEWREIGSVQPGDWLVLNRHRGISWDGRGTYDEGWLLGSLVGDGTFSTRVGTKQQELTMAHLDFWGADRTAAGAEALTRLASSVALRSDCLGCDSARHARLRLSSAGLAQLAAGYGLVPTRKTVTPAIETTSSAFHRGFLRGLFDADGSVQGTQAKGVSIRLSQSDVATLEGVQRMLLRLGIVSMLYADRRPAGYRQLPDGRGGTAAYWCRGDHELVIADDNVQEFASVVGFSNHAKAERLTAAVADYRRQPNRERFTATITSIEPDGVEDVFDCSVPGPNAFDANGFVSHNCGEIVLRPNQFCNLSIAVARADDTLDTLQEKVEVATIIGTIQSLATHFPDLRPIWKQNSVEERLLGVDITGQMDSPVVHDPAVMRTLREVATETNLRIASQLGINQSAAITTVKPSGNSSQLLNCSSGLHARWAPYYERNVRVAATSPIFKVLRDAGVPMDPENGQTADDATTWVIHFPMKSPDGAITRKDRGAIEQCNYWLHNKLNWTDHNPSITVTYRPDEIVELTTWIWEHRYFIGGMAFLPTFDAQYAQLPYIEITREEYERRVAEFPEIDFSKLWRYEAQDLTTAAQELACLAGGCEVDV